MVVYYLYSTGSLTEEKLVEKIAEHWDEPFADLHAPTKNQLQQIKEVSELAMEEKKDDLRPVSPPPTVS